MDGSLTPRLHFPVAMPPAAGETLLVAPGVYWLRMPLPFALDHINLWLLEERDGLARAQSRADGIAGLFGQRASGPTPGETALEYRRRLAGSRSRPVGPSLLRAVRRQSGQSRQSALRLQTARRDGRDGSAKRGRLPD